MLQTLPGETWVYIIFNWVRGVMLLAKKKYEHEGREN